MSPAPTTNSQPTCSQRANSSSTLLADSLPRPKLAECRQGNLRPSEAATEPLDPPPASRGPGLFAVFSTSQWPV